MINNKHSVGRLVKAILVLMCMSGCDEANHSSSLPKELKRTIISEDCAFWAEADDGLGVIRVGVSGACSEITLKDYANELRSALSEAKDAIEYNVIYLNMHDGSKAMAEKIASITLSSNTWISCSNKIDECFLDVVNESGYFELINNAIYGKFGNQYKLAFIGVECEIVTGSEFEKLDVTDGKLSKCHPLSFGLAVYKKIK